MREQIIAAIKSVLRPIAQKRLIIERMKYSGRHIAAPQEGNDLLAQLIHKPGAVGKIGDSELRGLRRYMSHADKSGRCTSWGRSAINLYRNAGVYPPDPEIFSRFCTEYFNALSQLDVLAVWFRPREANVQRRYAPNVKLVSLTSLEPYYHQRPWSAQLAGKRVVVVTPFAQTIERQYQRREQIWAAKPQVLPEFHLRTVRCPLSAALEEPVYPDWFAALDAMKRKMAEEPFDVAIVGAGAWSIPLAVHAKSLGAWGIHLGGPTQILFGVLGGRWDANADICAFQNDAWARPSTEEKPNTFRKIENGCYW
jgi:hypothetical protein